MNGRIYDPLVGRVMSADTIMQAPAYSQSFNRYSYAWNNPLKYVDPSGYDIFFQRPPRYRQSGRCYHKLPEHLHKMQAVLATL